MNNQPINNLNLNAPQWNYPATEASGQVPGVSNPMLITPSYDATNITGGLPNTGAQSMNAPSSAPSGNWYADWFSQWSNTMQGLNATIQGGAMPMDATTTQSYNYAPVPSYYNNPNYINTYQGATPMENQDPNLLNQNGDIVIPEANTDSDGNLNVTLVAKTDTATGQLTGQNATVDSTAKNQTGSISSDDGGTLANTITLKASDKDAGGNNVSITADAKDTINTQGSGWKFVSKDDNGTITLKQTTEGGKENTYTITPQKGTKVIVNGKDVNSTSIFKGGDDVNANGVETGKPGDANTSGTLYGQLTGQSSDQIAKVDMSDSAVVKLTDDQKKIVAQQYALAYTKEKLGDAGKDLTVDKLTQQQIDDAKTALDGSDNKNTDLSAELGKLKSTAPANFDQLLKQLQGGQVNIDKSNVDLIDFNAIAKLPKDQRLTVMRNMKFSNDITQQQKDKLTLKFVSVVNNGFADDLGVSRGDSDLNDDTVTPDDLETVKTVASTCFNAPFITDNIHNMAEHTKNLGLAGSGESRYELQKKDFGWLLGALNSDSKKTLQQIIDAEHGKTVPTSD